MCSEAVALQNTDSTSSSASSCSSLSLCSSASSAEDVNGLLNSPRSASGSATREHFRCSLSATPMVDEDPPERQLPVFTPLTTDAVDKEIPDTNDMPAKAEDKPAWGLSKAGLLFCKKKDRLPA